MTDEYKGMDRQQLDMLTATESVHIVMNILFNSRSTIVSDREDTMSIETNDYRDDSDIVFALACSWLPF